MLVLICGLPATGKSTIARKLAKKINAVILRTDKIRKEIFPSPTYTEEEKALVYKITFLIAKYLLNAKVNVIIDGTFYKRNLRKEIYKIVEQTKTKLFIIECVAPEEIIKARMYRRRLRKSLSDANFEVYKKIKKQFEPIHREHLVIDTRKPIKENMEEIYRFLAYS